MASKRDGSILDFFTKKIKSTTFFSTEEIELTEISTISEDKTHEASSLIQNAPLVDLLNPSNINDLPENYDESENESEFFGNFDKSPNTNKQISSPQTTDNQTSPQQTTNLSLSNRSTQIEIVSSKCEMYCCNSSKPYHPVTDDELALTTIDKRSCQKGWFMDHSWLTFCKVSFCIKQITKISTICEIFNSCEVGKEMFKEYHKLIKLYLTIPVTTATAERTFSTLNRLKTAIRSTMTQSRLNHCLLPHIYKEKLDKIDPRHIASKFISSNEKRQHFFGLIL